MRAISREAVEIDGSLGEGGGQVVRTAVSLSAITGTPVEVVGVRARRERPGLQPQHLAAVRAVATICDAVTVGDRVGSDRFLFEPRREPLAGDYTFDIRTAGAASLVLQSVLAPLLHADGESVVEVIGGTHQPMSPSADYLVQIYARALARFGADVDVEYGPAGYYPRGGGRVRAIVGPSELHPIELVERGTRRSLDAYVVTSRLNDDVAERGAAVVSELVPDATIRCSRPFAFSPGAAVTIATEDECGFGGASAIGERGLPMEDVALRACREFAKWDTSGAACDEHLADQLVLPAALARGTSRWTTPRVTEHLRTVIDVVGAFLSVRAIVEDGRVELTRTPERS